MCDLKIIEVKSEIGVGTRGSKRNCRKGSRQFSFTVDEQ
jgi:hypothetical protein